MRWEDKLLYDVYNTGFHAVNAAVFNSVSKVCKEDADIIMYNIAESNAELIREAVWLNVGIPIDNKMQNYRLGKTVESV